MHCIVCRRFWLVQTCIKAMKTNKSIIQWSFSWSCVWYVCLAEEVTPVYLTNEVAWLANMFENSICFFLISASLKSIFYQTAYHFSMVWAEFCKAIRNCTFLWFQVRFCKFFFFSFLSIPSLQCFSLKLLGWWNHTDSINYWYLHSEMNHRIIQYSEWEGTYKLMPPMVLCFEVFWFVFFKFCFILVLPFASLNYAGAVLCSSL